jgi:hypothetical protein
MIERRHQLVAIDRQICNAEGRIRCQLLDHPLLHPVKPRKLTQLPG